MYGLYVDCVWLYAAVYKVHGLVMACMWLHMCSVSATAAGVGAAAAPTATTTTTTAQKTAQKTAQQLLGPPTGGARENYVIISRLSLGWMVFEREIVVTE